jgi:uncharacterized protein (DUF885 family)
MRTWKRWTLGVGGAALLGLTAFAVPTVWGTPYKVEHFYARLFARFALDSPALLAQMRILPAWADFTSDDLDDRSLAHQEEMREWLDGEVRVLRSYDRASLADPLSYDVLAWFLEDQQAGNRFRFHNYPVNQLFGEQSNLPNFLLNVHQVKDARGARDYVTRLSKVGTYFDQVLEGVLHREKLGVVPPKFVVQRVLKEMRDFVAKPPAEHVLTTHLAEALGKVEGVDAAEREALVGQAREQVERTVYPAYGRLIDTFARLEGVATTDDGAWKLPDGEAFYAYQLRHHTTTDMTAEQVHQTGLAEVARIQEEMRGILRAQGRDATDLRAAMTALREEPRFTWPDTDEGRAAILAEYQRIIDEVNTRLAPAFSLKPKAPVKVERVPTFREATSAGAYYTGAAMDGSRPGIFWANLRGVDEHAKFAMRTLAYHEAVPGHHFQISVAQELQGVPFFRRVVPFTAFSEGWALYAEQVAAELGLQDDPFDRLGYLDAQLFRAVRLVVDTGLHAQRWPREKAIAYMTANTGMTETDVVAEVERYIVNPGQACAYMVGRLKLLELREKAKARLGAKFDLPAFHTVVIGSGAMPLTLVERRVEAWVEAQAGGPAVPGAAPAVSGQTP